MFYNFYAEIKAYMTLISLNIIDYVTIKNGFGFEIF